MPPLLRCCLVLLTLAACSLATVTAADRGAEDEIAVPQELLQKLDEFERQAFAKPEGLFAKGKWKEAMAAYDAYCLQYSKSDLVAFAYLRKGRCLEHTNKRLESVKIYQDVLDFFPNLVTAAAPALYYQGRAQIDNGDEAPGLKCYARMAADPGYSRHPLAAQAVVTLADALVQRERAAQALPYYTQVALDFRDANPGAAHAAIQRLVHHLAKACDEAKLRDLYAKAGGFHERRQKVPEDPSTTREYWSAVLDAVPRAGVFTDVQADARKAYYAAWARHLDGRFPDWDDYQIARLAWRRSGDGDAATWTADLDRLYAAGQKPGDDARTLRWMRLFAADRKQVQAYYARLDFARMPNERIHQVCEFLYDELKDADLGRNVAGKLRLDELDDDARERLAEWFWKGPRDLEFGLRLNASMKDQERARFGLFQLHAGGKKPDPAQVDKALALSAELVRSERYGARTSDLTGDLLVRLKRDAEAIEHFRRANLQPEGSFKIAGCLARTGKVAPAVDELTQIEHLFQAHAPRAALQIAYVYRDAGEAKKKDMVAQFRKVLTAYKASKEASSAHQELERLGIPITGGLDADDERNPGGR